MLTEIASGSSRVRRAPGLELAAGLAQHPRAELHDEAGLLGQRDEVLRQQPAELRVLPAEQRLDPVDARRSAGSRSAGRTASAGVRSIAARSAASRSSRSRMSAYIRDS